MKTLDEMIADGIEDKIMKETYAALTNTEMEVAVTYVKQKMIDSVLTCISASRLEDFQDWESEERS